MGLFIVCNNYNHCQDINNEYYGNKTYNVFHVLLYMHISRIHLINFVVFMFKEYMALY